MQGFVTGGVNSIGNNIKSIQHISASFGSGDASKSVAISAIDTNKTIVAMLGGGAAGSVNADVGYVTATIANTTTVTFQRGLHGAALTFNAVVIEFYTVKSLQVLTITQDDASETTAINSINTAKSLVFATARTDVASGAYVNTFRYYLNSATEFVSVFSYNSANARVVAYVVEFY